MSKAWIMKQKIRKKLYSNSLYIIQNMVFVIEIIKLNLYFIIAFVYYKKIIKERTSLLKLF